MGQKVHPTGIRLGIAKDWNSTWYAEKGEYAEQLNSDLAVREYLTKRLAQAAVSRITIERPAKSARITIHTARPGIVIGKKGEDIEKLRRDVSRLMGVPTHITVAEIRKPELDAQLVELGRQAGFHGRLEVACRQTREAGAPPDDGRSFAERRDPVPQSGPGPIGVQVSLEAEWNGMDCGVAAQLDLTRC